MASVWGCSLIQAREVYMKVVCSTLVYRAGVWHQPAQHRPKGIAAKLAASQSSCLRAVTGAYRATPVYLLEAEATVLPLDIYLNKRVADFEARLERTRMDTLIRTTCSGVVAKLRQCRYSSRPRGGPTRAPSLEYGEGRTAWATEWAGDTRTRKILEEQWRECWRRL